MTVYHLDQGARARGASAEKSTGNDEIEWPDTIRGGVPAAKSQDNIRAALSHLGVFPWFDAFKHKYFVRTNGRAEGPLDDCKIREIYLALDRMGLTPPKEYLIDVLLGIADENARNPVREAIDALKWDGVRRLDVLGPKYFGAEDTPFVRAAFRKTLIAMVRRVRCPGTKFDTLLVLEGKQGCGKSSGIQILATPELYTDCAQPGDDPRLTIENTTGRLIVEFSELNGFSKRATEATKAGLSRQVDTARLAYARTPVEIPRAWIPIGSTNSDSYLKDVTGNRRFWPAKVKRVDLNALTKDRDQLVAEAAHEEAKGESLVLPEELWGLAASEQAARLISDPWFEKLEPHLEGKRGAIKKEEVWEFLGVETARQDPTVGTRIGEQMARLGFQKGRRRHPGERRLVHCFESADLIGPIGSDDWITLPKSHLSGGGLA